STDMKMALITRRPNTDSSSDWLVAVLALTKLGKTARTSAGLARLAGVRRATECSATAIAAKGSKNVRLIASTRQNPRMNRNVGHGRLRRQASAPDADATAGRPTQAGRSKANRVWIGAPSEYPEKNRSTPAQTRRTLRSLRGGPGPIASPGSSVAL